MNLMRTLGVALFLLIGIAALTPNITADTLTYRNTVQEPEPTLQATAFIDEFDPVLFYQQSGIVPIDETYQELYASRNRVSFTVFACPPTNAITRQLVAAAERAAENWNRITEPHFSINLSIHSCEFALNVGKWGNRKNEIYLVKTGDRFVQEDTAGGYISIKGATLFVEEDIIVNRTVISKIEDPEYALEFILTHELGHALGLEDAYLVEGQRNSCGFSIMLPLGTCVRQRDSEFVNYHVDPTPKPLDIEALERVYGREFSSPTNPPPNQDPKSTLSYFDLNSDRLLNDSEFFVLLDAWLADDVADTLFFDGVDYWISQAPLPVSTQSTFSLQDAHEITIFDQNGTTLDIITDYRRLQAMQRMLANGVYIYRACSDSACWTGFFMVMR